MKKRSLSELTSFEDWEKKLLADPDVKKDLPFLEAEYQIMKRLIDLRLKSNVTQKELAKRIYTKQPSVSRLERGLTNPSIYFLSKIAHALGKRLEINFK